MAITQFSYNPENYFLCLLHNVSKYWPKILRENIDENNFDKFIVSL